LPREITKDTTWIRTGSSRRVPGTIKLMDEEWPVETDSRARYSRPQQETRPRSADHRVHQRSLRNQLHECDKVKFFAENMGRRLKIRKAYGARWILA